LSTDGSRRCGACGVQNVIEARYCRGCGTMLPAPADGGVTGADPPPPPPQPSAVPSHVDIAQHAWREVRGVAWLFLVLVAMVVTAFVAEKLAVPETTVDLVLAGAVALVSLVLAASAWRDIAPLLATAGGLRGLFAAILGFGALLGFWALYFPICKWLGFPLVRATDAHVAAGWPSWVSYLLVSVAPAVTEELMFRGYVMGRLSRMLTPNEVLLVQAALFSVLHFGIVIFPSHFVIGVALGLVRRLTGSLYPGMAVHAAWNGRLVWLELAA